MNPRPHPSCAQHPCTFFDNVLDPAYWELLTYVTDTVKSKNRQTGIKIRDVFV